MRWVATLDETTNGQAAIGLRMFNDDGPLDVAVRKGKSGYYVVGQISAGGFGTVDDAKAWATSEAKKVRVKRWTGNCRVLEEPDRRATPYEDSVDGA